MADCLTAMDLPVPEISSHLDKLIESARTGEREALEDLLCAIERRVLVFAWRLTGDAATAEDVAQETYLAVCGNLSSYRQGTSFWAWLYRIALNKSRDRLRSERRFASLEAIELSGPEHDSDRAQQLRRVFAAMSVLSERERVALVLIDVEGFSSAEAARVMGCLQLTARSRASHARKKIRAELSRHYPELRDNV